MIRRFSVYLLVLIVLDLSGSYIKAQKPTDPARTLKYERAQRLDSIAEALENEDSKESKRAAIAQFTAAIAIYREIGSRAEEATASHYMGRALADLGENDAALIHYSRALQVRREIGDKEGESKTLNNIGLVYRELGQHQKALEYLNNALPLIRSTGDRAREAITLNNIALVYDDLADKTKSIEARGMALDIHRALGNRQEEADALFNIGSTYGDLGEQQRAVENLGLALKIYRALNGKGDESDTLFTIGNTYQKTGEHKKALEYFNLALPIYRELGRKEDEAHVLANSGITYVDLGEKVKALELLGQALSVYRALGSKTDEANTLYRIADAQTELGNRSEALQCYEQALLLFRAVDDKNGEAGVLNGLGNIHSDLRDKQKALEFYQKSLDIHRTLGDKREEGRTLSNIGNLHTTLGEYQTALEYFDKALSARQAAGDKTGEAITLNNIGNAYDSLGDLKRSAEYFERSLKISREIGNKQSEAFTLRALGRYYDSLHDSQRSLDYLEKALTLYRSLGAAGDEASTLNAMSRAYRLLGEMQKELATEEQVLALNRANGDKRGEAIALNNLAGVYQKLGERQKAFDHYHQSLLASRSSGDRETEGIVLGNIGLSYLDSGDPQKAMEYLNQALSVRRESGGKMEEAIVLNSIGDVYDRLGEKQKAVEKYQNAIKLFQSDGVIAGEAISLNRLGSVSGESREYQRALEYFSAALPLHRALGDEEEVAVVLRELSRFARAEGNRDLAIFFGKRFVAEARRLQSKIRNLDVAAQKSFLRQRDSAFQELAEMLILQNRLVEAHQVILASRDQQYFDADPVGNEGSDTPWFNSREASFQQQFESFFEQHASFSKRVAERQASNSWQDPLKEKELRKDLELVKAGLMALFEAARTEFSKPVASEGELPVNDQLTAMQRALSRFSNNPDGVPVAVYQVLGPEKLQSLIVSGNRIEKVSVEIKQVEMNEKAKKFWALLQSDKYDTRELGKELYEAVFKPIEHKLPKNTKTILWSLDGNLRYIPMGALFDGNHYLIERYNNVNITRSAADRLTRASRASDWAATAMGTSQGHTVALLGDSIPFEPLPGVAAEFEQLFGPAGQGGVLGGNILREGRFDQKNMIEQLALKRPVVHIASHFSFRPGDEARSFLLMGDGTAFTLADMKKHSGMFAGVQLLTLSACSTAAQQADANGREVDGFAELAQRLGADSVLATLWQVSDNSTPWLMREFYSGKIKRGLSKAEALRQAQLALLHGSYGESAKPVAGNSSAKPSGEVAVVTKDGKPDGNTSRGAKVFVRSADAPQFTRDEKKPFAHPFYWAPFILFGNWQ